MHPLGRQYIREFLYREGLRAFLNEKNAYGYIASGNGKAVGFAYGYVLNEPNGQKVYYLRLPTWEIAVEP